MDTALLISLIGFAFVSAGTPGPNNLLLMSSGALFGWRRTLPHLGGVLLGFAVVNASAVFGLGSVVDQWPWLISVIRIVGASWLAWLSVRFFRAAFAPQDGTNQVADAPISRPFRFIEAVLFQWVNPKAWAMALTAISVYTPPSHPLLSVFLVALVFGLINLPSVGLWVLLGTGLRRLLSNPLHLRIFNYTAAILLVASLYPILTGLE